MADVVPPPLQPRTLTHTYPNYKSLQIHANERKLCIRSLEFALYFRVHKDWYLLVLNNFFGYTQALFTLVGSRNQPQDLRDFLLGGVVPSSEPPSSSTPKATPEATTKATTKATAKATAKATPKATIR